MFHLDRRLLYLSISLLSLKRCHIFLFLLFTFLQGIVHQGSNAIYAGQPCHKGHLYAAMTASGLPQNPPPLAPNVPNPMNAANSARSTYQYTNAVPQCGGFNRGQWRVFEGRIRQYEVQTCIPQTGMFYLITGVSVVAITNANPPQPAAVQISTIPPPVPNQPLNPAAIFQPNSLWTAGKCVFPNGQSQSFPVIGNNVLNSAAMLTQEITQAQLLVILQFDIQTNGLKRDRVERVRVNLFPGLRSSAGPIRLPLDEYPPALLREEDERGSSTKPLYHGTDEETRMQ